MEDRATRRWIRAMVLVQLWPATLSTPPLHLATVHLPLSVGAAGGLVALLAALGRAGRRAAIGIALPVAVAGSVVSAGAEAWHALSHLEMDTHHAPVAGTLSFLGFLVVVAAMLLSSCARHRRADRASSERRAA